MEDRPVMGDGWYVKVSRVSSKDQDHTAHAWVFVVRFYASYL